MNDEIATTKTPGYRPIPYWAALSWAVFTWPLLFVGGLVTTYRVGMAVPDWPTTFGMNMFLYNFFQAPWGVVGEHAHRLYAAAVGLYTIALMLVLWGFDRRGWMKALGAVALLAVIGQGVLGGLRVTRNSTTLAAVHGATAQAFFVLMVALVVLTGRGWFAKPRVVADAGKYRRLTASALVLLYGQAVVGAWLRHFGYVPALQIHAVAAFLIFGHVAAVVARIARKRREVPELYPSAAALGFFLVLQIALGVGAWWLLRPYDGIARPVTLLAALVRTGHQANGALVLASATVLTLRAFGRLVPDGRRSESESDFDPGPAGVGSLEREAVA